jgi:hypothetical protein
MDTAVLKSSTHPDWSYFLQQAEWKNALYIESFAVAYAEERDFKSATKWQN